MHHSTVLLAYASEVDRAEFLHSILPLIIAGCVGGLLNCAIHNYFSQVKPTRLKDKLNRYGFYGLFHGLGACAIAYSVFAAYPISTIKAMYLFDFPLTIAALPIWIVLPPIFAMIAEFYKMVSS